MILARYTMVAVVEVAWDDGKLSCEGVPTPIRMSSWSGRRRRTILLRMTDAA
jgi:hypothetical protein